MEGGGTKPIEELRIGDRVMSFSREEGKLTGRNTQGRRVLGTASREYTGQIITVQARGEALVMGTVDFNTPAFTDETGVKVTRQRQFKLTYAV
jgi:hypothetical protein